MALTGDHLDEMRLLSRDSVLRFQELHATGYACCDDNPHASYRAGFTAATIKRTMGSSEEIPAKYSG